MLRFTSTFTSVGIMIHMSDSCDQLCFSNFMAWKERKFERKRKENQGEKDINIIDAK